MRKVIVFVIVALAFLGFGRAAHAANTVTHFSTMEVSIWPEFDRPSVLVMYDIFLPKDVSLPARLQIPIPLRVGEPHAVAYIQPSGGLTNATYTYSANQQEGFVEINAMQPAIHIEYYDPSLTKKGKHRVFVYKWLGGFTVDDFKLVVQQPAGAYNIKLSPKMGEGVLANDELVYYRTDMGSLAAGDTFEVKVEYDKDTDALTKSSAATPSQSVPKSIKGETSLRDILPWVAVALGVLLIGLGGVVYWNLRRSPTPEPVVSRRRRGQPLPPEARSADTNGTINYCPVCGARVHPGDKYCRVCGTKLR